MILCQDMISFLFLFTTIANIPTSQSIGPGLAHFQPQMRTGRPVTTSWENSVVPYTNDANSYTYWNCHTIPPNMTLCKSVGYSRMVLPNFLQHESLREVIQQANVWVALVNTDCHPDIQRFLCSLYAPVCLKSHQESKIPPCWELCDQVRNACLPRMRLFGFDWPDIVQCKQFPKLAESMCIPPQENSAVKCAPCEQAMTLENIASSYCMADVVLKASFKDVILQSDRTSLQLIPNSKTRALKILRKDGTTTTNADVLRLWKRSRHRRHNGRSPNSRLHKAVERQENMDTNVYSGFFSKEKGRRIAQPTNRSFRPPRSTSFGDNRNNSSSDEPHWTPTTLENTRTEQARNSLPHNLDGITDLNLGCSTCSSLAPFSGAANPSELEQKRWLVMGRRIPVSTGKTYSGQVQVTLLLTWDRDSSEFRRAINAIRTQPVSQLCPKESMVEQKPSSVPTKPLGFTHNPKKFRAVSSELSDAPSTTLLQRSNPTNQLPNEPQRSNLIDPMGNKQSILRDRSQQEQSLIVQEIPTPPLQELKPSNAQTYATNDIDSYTTKRQAFQSRDHSIMNGVVQTVYPRHDSINKHEPQPSHHSDLRPSYENVINSWKQNGRALSRKRPDWYQTGRWNTGIERRRRRRRERRQWRRRQKEADVQQQQKHQLFVSPAPSHAVHTTLRQKPINPYVNEEPNIYEQSYWFPRAKH